MKDKIRVEFSDEFKSETSPFRVFARYFMWVTITTPDRNGDDIENAEIEVVDGTFEMFVNQIKDVFAYLPEEKDAPMFWARIREAAKAAYFEKRAVWQ